MGADKVAVLDVDVGEVEVFVLRERKNPDDFIGQMDLEDGGKVVEELENLAGVEGGWSGVLDVGFEGFETGGKGLIFVRFMRAERGVRVLTSCCSTLESEIPSIPQAFSIIGK